LGITPPLYGNLVKFSLFPVISLLVGPTGRLARRMLDTVKLKLNSAILVELVLGLSLEKSNKVTNERKNKQSG
jgi:hypothetical protein